MFPAVMAGRRRGGHAGGLERWLHPTRRSPWCRCSRQALGELRWPLAHARAADGEFACDPRPRPLKLATPPPGTAPTPDPERVTVLIRLLRDYLRPYRRDLCVRGGAPACPDARDPVPADSERRHHRQRRDHRQHPLHLADRRVHARGGARADHLRDRRGLLRRPDRDGAGPRPAAGRLQPGPGLLRPRGRPFRHAVADHPEHQRRPAGADAGADDVHADGRRPRSCASAASSWR